MPASRLLWLQIHAYEQFEPVRIEFSERENLLLGVNGAGKSRLLRLIRAVLRLQFVELTRRPFHVEFKVFSWRDSSSESPIVISGSVKNTRVVADEGDTIVEAQPSMMLEAVLTLVRGARSLRMSVRDQDVVYEVGETKQSATFSAVGDVRPDYRHLRESRHRNDLVDLMPILDAAFMGESDREFQVLRNAVEVTFQGAHRASVRTVDPQAALQLFDLRPFVMMYVSIPMSRRGTAEGEAPERSEIWIPELLRPLGMSVLWPEPQIVRESADEVVCRGVGLRAKFLDGTEVSDAELTFGQRRYLYAGIVFLLHPGAPALVDELDNGMHPRLMETLLGLWQDRQVFLVSHNKLVIDYTNFAGPEDVQKKIHLIQRREDGRQVVRVLGEEEAREVYEKIAVAIQSPSDVLRAEGLW